MKVILLKGMPKVGKPGEVVTVSDGYAANALFPHKLAIPATEKNLQSLKNKKDAELHAKALQHELLEKAIMNLPNELLILTVKANDKGHLFSKVDESDIVAALLTHRVSIAPKNITLPSPIKALGTYTVLLQEGSYKKEITISIVPAK